jgi:hypothetical protein
MAIGARAIQALVALEHFGAHLYPWGVFGARKMLARRCGGSWGGTFSLRKEVPLLHLLLFLFAAPSPTYSPLVVRGSDERR